MIVSELKEVMDVKLGEQSVSKVMVGDREAWSSGHDYFYIYHTSSGVLEKHEVQPHFNLVDRVSSNTIYAGYSTHILYNNVYKIVGDYTKAIIDGNFEELYPNIEFTDGKLQDINCHIYDGSSLYYRDTDNNTILYIPVKTYYATVNGSDFTPVKDTVYYLIEAPNSLIDVKCYVVADSVDSSNKYNAYEILLITDSARYKSAEIYVNNVVCTLKSANGNTLYYGVDGIDKSTTVNSSSLGFSRCTTHFSNDLMYYTGHSMGSNTPFSLNSEYIFDYKVTTYDGVILGENIQYKLTTGDGTNTVSGLKWVSYYKQ